MQSLGERASCQLWHALFNIVSVMQFGYINSKEAINWINSDFVKVLENSVTFYWAKCLSYSKQIGTILKSNTSYVFWLASRRNGYNQYWTPWAKFIYFLCENLPWYLCFSLSVTTDLSSCLYIAATLVQLIINSLLDHFNLPLVPSHPSSHIQFILSTAVIF